MLELDHGELEHHTSNHVLYELKMATNTRATLLNSSEPFKYSEASRRRGFRLALVTFGNFINFDRPFFSYEYLIFYSLNNLI